MNQKKNISKSQNALNSTIKMLNNAGFPFFATLALFFVLLTMAVGLVAFRQEQDFRTQARLTGLAQEQFCVLSGGHWREFTDNCVDSCDYHRNPNVGCARVMTYGCDCGPDQCWDGQRCQPIGLIQRPTEDRAEQENEQRLCSVAGGSWREFTDSCVDLCSFHRNENVFCATVMTFGCDCGPDQCWDGEQCQPIAAVPPSTGVEIRELVPDQRR